MTDILIDGKWCTASDEVVVQLQKISNNLKILAAAVVELSDRESTAHTQPCRDTRLAAWQAKRDLFKLVGHTTVSTKPVK